ncbi:MmcQ/YjbR family DNA-binding protein [Photobacterium profundum]|uniref:MmcQ-like protein n=1 Tax=Photobacterium profundum (strain SS9) TaxID=298386 RepID=Q6LQZ8_PHOPR|nr:MmcQ/YjbR family DNA-binding protein [Photobacterium profundum]CAG20278.1 hypothetical protein PBPRA1874 [Photobacterium profundum SS9]
MEIESLEKYLLSLKGAQGCYPFGPEAYVFKVMGKMFALTAIHNGIPSITLKCLPADGDFLVNEFASIIPGYHMNKQHWITIALTGELSESMLQDLADKSYNLVVSKLTRVNKEALSAL